MRWELSRALRARPFGLRRQILVVPGTRRRAKRQRPRMRGLVLPWWAALPERGYRMRCWFRGRGFCVRPARASAPAWSSLRTRLTAAQARESPGPRLPCACQLGKRRGGRRGTPRNNGADERTRTADLLITNQLLYQLSYVGREELCGSAQSRWILGDSSVSGKSLLG